MTSPAGEAAMPEQQGRPRDDRATPDFSVVVPAFNCAAFLADALDSILAQEGVSVEVLVVDDGSTDNTAERARTYDARVRLLSTARPRSGPGAARNVGIRHARAPVVAFLDGDDVWLPGKLALQKRVLDENPDVALVCTRGVHWFPEREGDAAWQQAAPPESPASGEIPFRPAGWIYHLLLLRPAWVWTSTVVMRRELIERTGEFDETLRLGQDYDYWLRASRETRILRIDRILALYRQHADNSTHTPRAQFRARDPPARPGPLGPCGSGRVHGNRNAVARTARRAQLPFWLQAFLVRGPPNRLRGFRVCLPEPTPGLAHMGLHRGFSHAQPLAPRPPVTAHATALRSPLAPGNIADR